MGIMCAYGNCTETMEAKASFKLTVTESNNGTVTERQSFCCYEHAIMWLMKRQARHFKPLPVEELMKIINA